MYREEGLQQCAKRFNRSPPNSNIDLHRKLSPCILLVGMYGRPVRRSVHNGKSCHLTACTGSRAPSLP